MLRGKKLIILLIFIPIFAQAFLPAIPYLIFSIGATMLAEKGVKAGVEWWASEEIKKSLKEVNLENLLEEDCLRISGLFGSECRTDFQKNLLSKPYSQQEIEARYLILYNTDRNGETEFFFPIFINQKQHFVVMDKSQYQESLEHIQYRSMSRAEEKKAESIKFQWKDGISAGR